MRFLVLYIVLSRAENQSLIKFVYSGKATKFCKIFPLLLTTVHTVKSKGKISSIFVAFLENVNFKNVFRKMQMILILEKCL